jgi:hypothetical protein
MGALTSSFELLLHHSEYIDPTLVDWIKHEIDDIFGLGPATIVVVLGLVTLAFPVGLLLLAWRRARRARGER